MPTREPDLRDLSRAVLSEREVLRVSAVELFDVVEQIGGRALSVRTAPALFLLAFV